MASLGAHSADQRPQSEPGVGRVVVGAIRSLIPIGQYFDGAEVSISQRGERFIIDVRLLRAFGDPKKVALELKPNTKELIINGKTFVASDRLIESLGSTLEEVRRGEPISVTYKPGNLIEGAMKPASSAGSAQPEDFSKLPQDQRVNLEIKRDEIRLKFALAVALEKGFEGPFETASSWGGTFGGEGGNKMTNGLAKRHTKVRARDGSSISLYDSENPQIFDAEAHLSNFKMELKRPLAHGDLQDLYAKHRREVDSLIAAKSAREVSPEYRGDRLSETLLEAAFGVGSRPAFDHDAYASRIQGMSDRELAAENLEVGTKLEAACQARLGKSAVEVGGGVLDRISKVERGKGSTDERIAALMQAGIDALTLSATLPPDLHAKAQILTLELGSRFPSLIEQAHSSQPALLSQIAKGMAEQGFENARGIKGMLARQFSKTFLKTLDDPDSAKAFIDTCIDKVGPSGALAFRATLASSLLAGLQGQTRQGQPRGSLSS